MKWIEALRLWNAEHNPGKWCVPRRGTEGHAEVRAMMARGAPQRDALREAEHAAVAPKKKRKIKISDEEEIDYDKLHREERLKEIGEKAKKAKIREFLKKKLEERKAKKAEAAKPKRRKIKISADDEEIDFDAMYREERLKEIGEKSKKGKVKAFLKKALEKHKAKKASSKAVLESVKSLGQFCWRRFGGEDVEGRKYHITSHKTSFEIYVVKAAWDAYWNEWKAVWNKKVCYEDVCVTPLPDSDLLKVEVNGITDKDDANIKVEKSFGMTLMNKPEKATIYAKDEPIKWSPLPPEIKTYQEGNKYVKQLIEKYAENPTKYVLKDWNEDHDDRVIPVETGGGSGYEVYIKNSPELRPGQDYFTGGSDFSYRIFYNSTRVQFKNITDDWRKDILTSFKREFESEEEDDEAMVLITPNETRVIPPSQYKSFALHSLTFVTGKSPEEALEVAKMMKKKYPKGAKITRYDVPGRPNGGMKISSP